MIVNCVIMDLLVCVSGVLEIDVDVFFFVIVIVYGFWVVVFV